MEAAELYPLLAVLAQALGELLCRPAEEGRLVQLRVEVTGSELELLVEGGLQLRLGDVAVPVHRAQDLVPPDERRVWVPDRVEHGWSLRQAGEERSLDEGQPRGRLREVRP